MAFIQRFTNNSSAENVKVIYTSMIQDPPFRNVYCKRPEEYDEIFLCLAQDLSSCPTLNCVVAQGDDSSITPFSPFLDIDIEWTKAEAPRTQEQRDHWNNLIVSLVTGLFFGDDIDRWLIDQSMLHVREGWDSRSFIVMSSGMRENKEKGTMKRGVHIHFPGLVVLQIEMTFLVNILRSLMFNTKWGQFVNFIDPQPFSRSNYIALRCPLTPWPGKNATQYSVLYHSPEDLISRISMRMKETHPIYTEETCNKAAVLYLTHPKAYEYDLPLLPAKKRQLSNSGENSPSLSSNGVTPEFVKFVKPQVLSGIKKYFELAFRYNIEEDVGIEKIMAVRDKKNTEMYKVIVYTKCRYCPLMIKTDGGGRETVTQPEQMEYKIPWKHGKSALKLQLRTTYVVLDSSGRVDRLTSDGAMGVWCSSKHHADGRRPDFQLPIFVSLIPK